MSKQTLSMQDRSTDKDAREPTDLLDRPLRDLRISVTDRCNFRCTYCMPKEIFGRDYQFLSREALLTFEEITQVARVATEMGVHKIRLTGGEPLLRQEVEELVAMLAGLPDVELAMTTNGALLRRKAQALKEAGLDRITVSLDALEDEVFAAMNDVHFPVAQVLDGIDAAAEVGLRPIKVNMVVQRGVNDHSILPMARTFREKGHILRLIEYMDVGTSNDWRMEDVVPAKEIVAMIDAEMPLEPIQPNYPGEVANRWRYRDGSGEIGVIASVTQPFCSTCTRARLSADGKLFTCLFAARGHDLRRILREEGDEESLRRALREIWSHRGDRYSEIRSAHTIALPKVEMSYIGG